MNFFMLFFHRKQHYIQDIFRVIERFLDGSPIRISSLYIRKRYDDTVIFWRQDCWIYIFHDNASFKISSFR